MVFLFSVISFYLSLSQFQLSQLVRHLVHLLRVRQIYVAVSTHKPFWNYFIFLHKLFRNEVHDVVHLSMQTIGRGIFVTEWT